MKLPASYDIQGRPVPEPVRQVVPYRPVEQSARSELARGLIGRAVVEGTLEVDQMLETQRRRQDEVDAEDRYNKAIEQKIELTNGENGFMRKKGEQAVNGDLYGDYTKKFDDQVKTIGDTLQTDRARRLYGRRAEIATLQYKEDILRHLGSEREAYGNEVYGKGVDLAVRTAAASYQDTAAILTSIKRIEGLTDARGAQGGWSEDRIKDAKLSAISALHDSVISMMIANGKDVMARDYFNKAKEAGQIGSPQLERIEKSLAISSTAGQAIATVTETWDRLGPKELNDPVKMATMEADIRNKHRDDPNLVHASIQELRSRAQGWNAEQTETTAFYRSSVLDAWRKGVKWSEIQRSPDFLKLSGADKEALARHIEDRGYTIQQRQRAEEEFQRSEQGRRAWGRWFDLSSPQKLVSMTENQIKALEPELGQHLTTDLVNKFRALKGSEEKVRAAQVDDDMFKVVADEAGLKPYDRDKSPDHAARLGRLKNAVEQTIDAEQLRLGKTLGRTEKEKIMRDVVKQEVMTKGFFWDTKQPAATVAPKDRANVYVPIANVPQEFKNDAINYMRSIGRIPPNMDTETAVRRHGKTIERAYGARLTGATTQEMIGILGTNIDLNKPIIVNPDGSISTERTITIESEGRHILIPTIVEGKPRPPEEAVRLWREGKNAAVGTYGSAAEAEAAAQERSRRIGELRAP